MKQLPQTQPFCQSKRLPIGGSDSKAHLPGPSLSAQLVLPLAATLWSELQTPMKTEVGGYQYKTTCVGFLTSHLCNAVPHKYNPQVPVPLKILFSGQFCWLPRAAALKALTPTYEAHYTAPIQSGLICKSNQRQATQQPVCASIRAHQTALSPPPPDTVLSVCSARPQKWFHHFLFNSRETSISCSTDIFIGCFFYVINIETLVYQGGAVTELPGQGSIKS